MADTYYGPGPDPRIPDPNPALEEIRSLGAEIAAGLDDRDMNLRYVDFERVARFAALVAMLDRSLSAGGLLPNAWGHGPPMLKD